MARLAALKEEIKRLACERDGIEARVSESSARLAATGVGMDKPLVDGEVRERGDAKEKKARERKCPSITSRAHALPPPPHTTPPLPPPPPL